VRLGKGKASTDDGPYAAVAGPGGEDGELARALGRLAAREVAPENAHDLAALEQREVERQARDLARCEAHDEVPPVPRDAPHRRFRKRAAHRIEDDVHPVGMLLLEERLQVPRGVVDDFVGALLLNR
jgi:hypothetical protein